MRPGWWEIAQNSKKRPGAQAGSPVTNPGANTGRPAQDRRGGHPLSARLEALFFRTRGLT